MKARHLILLYISIIISLFTVPAAAYIGVSAVPPLAINEDGRNKIMQLNILYGEAENVYGFNIGSINSVEDELFGIQLGGLGNIGDADIFGLQFAGISNSGRSMNGIQFSLFANITEKAMNGIRLFGCVNISDEMNGLEIGGLGNFVSDETRGIQLASLYNINGEFYGFQFAAFNVGGIMKGIQIGGAANITHYLAEGVQLSGLINYAGSPQTAYPMTLFQVAGLFNMIDGKALALQATAGVNYVKNASGLGIAGLCNFSDYQYSGVQLSTGINLSKQVSGVQLAGLLNYLEELKGGQIGGINVSNNSKGFQIGLINFTRNTKGVQLGAFNIIEEGAIPFMPIINMSFAGYRTALHDAIKTGKGSVAFELIEKGSGISYQNKNGNTPLHLICEPKRAAQKETVLRLIKKGAPLNSKNSLGNTPLHIAVRANNKELAGILLKKGADVNIKNALNFTPLTLAKEKLIKNGMQSLLKQYGGTTSQPLTRWTLMQLSFYPPVQLFGKYNDVNGLRLSIFYGINNDICGIDIGSYNSSASMSGIQVGLLNDVDGRIFMHGDLHIRYKKGYVNGLQFGLIANSIQGKLFRSITNPWSYAFQAATLFNFNDSINFGGIQIAGLGNINSRCMQTAGIQLSGLGNYNEALFTGFQFGGLLNVSGRLYGVQASLLFNSNKSDLYGLQFGLINITWDNLYGAQLPGLFNLVKDDLEGFQIGAINGGEDVSGFQIGGICNVVDDLAGVQISPCNISFGDMEGAQILGLVNYVDDDITGFQLGLLCNATDEDLFGLQFGVVNLVMEDMDIGQVGALVNYVDDTATGIQVGAFNYAERIKGVQIGIINFAERMSGVQIGAINIILEGAIPVLPGFNASMSF
ncbi:MAG: ankyrin repeat domain-containing protein [bacterium]|nr:ankyrin repeat domain-containing protein [bacterium]